MQTKRKQTLLAGAGLLTALTLTMAGCTPSKFTPGPGVPTQTNPGQSGAVTAPTEFDSVQGQATLKGVPLKNAEVRVYNAITGAPAVLSAGGANIIATGGGNAQPVGKTDENGNFSVNLAGLTGGNVARVVISAEGKTVTALMDSRGGFVERKGYAVTATTVSVTVNEISKLADILVAELLKTTSNVQDAEKRGSLVSGLLTSAANTANQAAPNFTGSALDELVNTPAAGTITLSDSANQALANNLGSSAASLASSIAAFATQLATLAAANQTGGGTVTINPASLPTIPGLNISLKDGKLQIGDTVINVGTTQPPATNPDTNNSPPPPPVIEFSPEVQNSPDPEKGKWNYKGDFSAGTATVTFDDENTMSVTQGDKAAQIQAMNVTVRKSSLTGTGGPDAFINSLTGSVSGVLQTRKDADGNTLPPVSKSGDLSFENVTLAGSLATAEIHLDGFGKIGTISAVDNTTSLYVAMEYTFGDDTAVQVVGAHTTEISSDLFDLVNKNGLYLRLATQGGSAEIQY